MARYDWDRRIEEGDWRDDVDWADLQPSAEPERLGGEHSCPACGLPVDDVGWLCWRCEEDDRRYG